MITVRSITNHGSERVPPETGSVAHADVGEDEDEVETLGDGGGVLDRLEAWGQGPMAVGESESAG